MSATHQVDWRFGLVSVREPAVIVSRMKDHRHAVVDRIGKARSPPWSLSRRYQVVDADGPSSVAIPKTNPLERRERHQHLKFVYEAHTAL
jgi:hypothetical protein